MKYPLAIRLSPVPADQTHTTRDTIQRKLAAPQSCYGIHIRRLDDEVVRKNLANLHRTSLDPVDTERALQFLKTEENRLEDSGSLDGDYLLESNRLQQALLTHDKIIIPFPVNSDMDAVGTGVLEANVLGGMGKEVLFITSRAISEKLKPLIPPEAEILSMEHDREKIRKFGGDLMLVNDCSDIDVMAGGKKRFLQLVSEINPKMLIVKIDHHQQGTAENNFGRINLVNQDAPCAALIAFDVFSNLAKVVTEAVSNGTTRSDTSADRPADPDYRGMFSLILAALHGDTLGLTVLRENGKKFFDLMRHLSHPKEKADVNLEAIANRFYLEGPAAILLLGEAIRNAEIQPLSNGFKLLTSHISDKFVDNLKKSRVPLNLFQDVELAKSVLGKVLGVDATLFYFDSQDKQGPLRKWMLRLNQGTRANFNVARAMEAAGIRGGGHSFSGGWAASESMADTVKKLVSSLTLDKKKGDSRLELEVAVQRELDAVTLLLGKDGEAAKSILNKEIETLDSLDPSTKKVKASALMVRILERTCLLTENVNQEPWNLEYLDTLINKGADSALAISFMEKYDLSDLKRFANNFSRGLRQVSYPISEWTARLLSKMDGERMTLTISNQIFNLQKPGDKQLLSFLTNATLNAFGLYRIRESESASLEYHLYHNGQSIDHDPISSDLLLRYFNISSKIAVAL